MAVFKRDNRRRLLLLLRKKLLVISLLVLNRTPAKKKYRRKRWWVHPIWRNRKREGHHATLLRAMRQHDHAYFKNYTRMSPQKFDLLLSLVRNKLEPQCFGRCDLITAEERLALTLRFLATGDQIPSMSYSFRIGLTTTCNINKNTCQVLWEVLQPIYMPKPTEETWKSAAKLYYNRWNFPLCCGAVDGKHVSIIKPSKSGSKFHNYKGFSSINLMAVVDARYKFLTIDVGGYGSSSDGGVFKSSNFGQDVTNQVVDFPPPSKLPGTDIEMRHVLLGDEAFQLLPNFMRPYPFKDLNSEKRVFNYRLSRARRCVENAFGILAARWRVYTKPIGMKPKNVDYVVKATTVLHNFLITEEGKNLDDKTYCSKAFAEKGWRENIRKNPANGLSNMTPTSARNYSKEANDNRDTFAKYFSSEDGEIEWQWELPGVVNPRL